MQIEKNLDYIMACDERGTTRWPSRSKTWAMGGLIVSSSKRSVVVSSWESIKEELCGNRECELKWSHFFSGSHQNRSHNPLLSNDPREWRQQAKWALSELFGSSKIVPVTTVVRKDKADNAMFMDEREDGIQILDINTLWVGVIGQYAIFLKQHDSLGEIWFDQLGSRKEEAQKQAAWEKLRNKKWPIESSHQETLLRISSELKFFDSKVEPLVQIADFVSGVLWAAAEGDEGFLLNVFKQYFPWGRNTYTFMFLT
jgi:hypothetical protein